MINEFPAQCIKTRLQKQAKAGGTTKIRAEQPFARLGIPLDRHKLFLSLFFVSFLPRKKIKIINKYVNLVNETYNKD